MVVQKLYNYLAAKNITKIALLTDTLGFGKDGKTNLKAQAAAYGMTIVADRDIRTERCRHADTAHPHQEQRVRRP